MEMAKQSKKLKFKDKYEVKDSSKITLTVKDDRDRLPKQRVDLGNVQLVSEYEAIDNYEINLGEDFKLDYLIITSESIPAIEEEHSIVLNYSIKCGEDEETFPHTVKFDLPGQFVVVRETIKLKKSDK